MGFLQKLWDETLAGPAPESGLSKLRKYNSFSGGRSSAAPQAPMVDDHVPVTRSITILRSNSMTPRSVDVSGGSGSVPSSPAGSSTPGSPFSPSTPRDHLKKYTRRRSMMNNEPKSSPKGYDWIVLSALER